MIWITSYATEDIFRERYHLIVQRKCFFPETNDKQTNFDNDI